MLHARDKQEFHPGTLSEDDKLGSHSSISEYTPSGHHLISYELQFFRREPPSASKHHFRPPQNTKSGKFHLSSKFCAHLPALTSNSSRELAPARTPPDCTRACRYLAPVVAPIRSFQEARSCGVRMHGFTSSAVIFWRAKGSGIVGIGWVGQANAGTSGSRVPSGSSNFEISNSTSGFRAPIPLTIPG